MRELIKKIAPSWAKELYRRLRAVCIRFRFKIFSGLPIEKKRVVFCNVWGYGDNPKWIARALRSCDKSIEIIFITNSLKYMGTVRGVKFVLNNSLRAAYYLSTAHVWVDCNRKEPYIGKKKGQYYIQTWHGSLPLKKLEADCMTELTEAYIENARRDSAMTDLYLSDSEFMNGIYRRAFMYNGEIMMSGSPRLDPLLRPSSDRIVSFKKRLEKQQSYIYGVQPDLKRATAKKLVVYAPTFRMGESDFIPRGFNNPDAILGALEKRFGGEFMMITRLHPLVAAGLSKRKNPKVADGNLQGDLYAILEAADVLITDYSNTLFEFAYAGKPVFLYAPDSKAYSAKRGMYFDYDELPYPHAASEKELSKSIEDYAEDEYKEKQKQFFDALNLKEDGRASRRVAEKIVRVVYKSGL